MKKMRFSLKFSILTALLLASCSPRPPSFPEIAPYFNWIQDTAPDDFSLTGRVYFWPSPTDEGVKIQLLLTGTIPDKKYYALIHQTGSCDNQGQAAGLPLSSNARLGSFKSDKNSIATFEKFSTDFSLGGEKNNIAGRALIISTDKKGLNRVGCTVIPVPQ